MNKILLKIGGMSCSACSVGIEKHLKKQPYIINATVNLVMANAMIEYDDNITIKDIEKYIKDIGYESLGPDDLKMNDNKIHNIEKIKMIIMIIISLLVLYVSMGPMIKLPIIPLLDMMEFPMNYALTLLLLSTCILFLGCDILKNGFKNLIHKTPNMDTLVTIGVLSAFFYSLFGTIMIINDNHIYVDKLYYESAVIIILFIKIGRFIDNRSKNKTKEAIKNLVQMTPQTATIKRDNIEKIVTIDEIVKGDIIICRPGEKISVDGEIIRGSTYLNESFITGESIPVSKKEKDKVIAGSINYDGYIEYKAEKIGRDSTISEIVRLVVESTATKAPIAKMADKICSYFVPFIILIACISFVVWLFISKDIFISLNIFISILIVSCPCALGLATPLSIVISSGVAAKTGILIKTSSVLEQASKINTVVFDKTGTLTKGTLTVSKINNYSDLTNKELFKIIGSIEIKSEHPISKAILNYCQKEKIKTTAVEHFKTLPGLGVESQYQNQSIIIGNKELLKKNKIEIKNHLEDETELTKNGNSILYVVINKKIAALIGVKDTINDSSKKVISELHKQRIKTIMLTGDNQNTALSLSKEINIDETIAGVLPSQKADIIKELKIQGNRVMMVGDGINDAPSLVTADIGVSISSGTDIAIDSADIIIIGNDLNKINSLIKISKTTIRNIKQNLLMAFIYNILMIPIAAGIFANFNLTINPIIAGIAMTLSSLTVIANSLRLRKINL